MDLGAIAQSGAILDQSGARNTQVSENSYFLRTGRLGKTAAYQTLERSITTIQPFKIQPPPPHATNGVTGSAAFIRQEPGST